MERFRHWIFDLDGTLTLAAHDFDAIRRELEIPAGRPILEHLERLPPTERALRTRRLDEIEGELARRARVASGAPTLLGALRARGASVAVLTRNSRVNALRTLDAVALADFFEPSLVLGRDEAPPKPDPGGVLHLTRHWNVDPAHCVLVGDFLYDLQAGRAAGTYTVHVDPSGEFRWRQHADLCIQRLDALLP